jgi:hypothetical protein
MSGVVYQTYYFDEKLSPDLCLSISIQGHAMASCLPVAYSRMSRQGNGRSELTAGDCIPCHAWPAHVLGRAYRRRRGTI